MSTTKAEEMAVGPRGHLHDLSGAVAYHPGAKVGRREVGLALTDPREPITVASKPRSCKSRRLRAPATTDDAVEFGRRGRITSPLSLHRVARAQPHGPLRH
jgi:hypothetical protein